MINVVWLLAALAWPLRAEPAAGSVDRLIDDIATHNTEGASEAELRRAALEGVVRWMRQTYGADSIRLLSAQRYHDRVAALRGQGDGFGLDLDIIGRYGIRIADVLPGSAAAEAGIQRGEAIVSVNGHSLAGMSTHAIQALLDKADRDVTVLEIQGLDGNIAEYPLVSRPYALENMSVENGETYTEIRVRAFGTGFGRAFAAQVRSGTGALILDLRSCQDGLLNEVIVGLAPLVGGGRSVARVTSATSSPRTLVTPSSNKVERDLFVIVDENTAGIAELFAMILQRGVPEAHFVGSQTAGVATMPEFVPFGDDMVFQIPGERLELADGSTWDGIGLIPDAPVAAFAGQPLGPAGVLWDPQMDAAIHLVGNH